MWEPQGLFADFILNQPVIFNGEGAIRGLYGFPAQRIAVIHGRGLTEQLKPDLQAVFKKQEIAFFAKSWRAEPHFADTHGTLAAVERFAPDVIIAVGGGSVIDGAKLCRLLYEFPYFDVHTTRLADVAFKTKFLAIPTTFGSGAEVSSAIMYMDDETCGKHAIVNHGLQPQVVVYDPHYIDGLGAGSYAAAMMDAVAHIVEGGLSKKRNDWVTIMAATTLSLVRTEVPALLQGKANPLHLQYIGYTGGIIQNHCLVGAAHAIAHQLGGKGYAHGLAVGLLLSSVLHQDCQNPEVAATFDRLLQDSGFTGRDEFYQMLDDILAYGGYLSKQKDFRAQLHTLLDQLKTSEAFLAAVQADPGGMGSVCPINKDFIYQIIEGL